LSNQTTDEKEDNARRRYVPLAIALLLVVVFILLFPLVSTEPDIELHSADSWASDGIDVGVEGTSVQNVTFGDPTTPLVVEWEEFSSEETEVEFEVLVRGSRDGRTWSNGRGVTGEEVLARDNYTVKGETGTAELTWSDIFGEERPVSIGDHDEMSAADFVTSSGETTRRSLDITVRATVPEEEVVTQGSTLLSAVMQGISPDSEPVTNEVRTRLAVVVLNPGERSDEGDGTDGQGSTNTGEDTPEVPDPPPGVGGGPISPPVPPEVRVDADVIGSGSFEVSSDHEVEEGE
jgi:hypothetical protein